MSINDKNETFYDILETHPGASMTEIRQAYLNLKIIFNRDSTALYSLIGQGERESLLDRIEEAYQVLSNPEAKRVYDANYGLSFEQENPFLSLQESELLQETLKSESVEKEESIFFGSLNSEDPSQIDLSKSVLHLEDQLSQLSYKDPKNDSITSKPASAQKEIIDQKIAEAPEPTGLDLESEELWPGSLFKKIREHQHISIEEMSEKTKISKNYITALEEENFAKLPAPVFVRGFLLQIGRWLKIPYEKASRAYLVRYQEAYNQRNSL